VIGIEDQPFPVWRPVRNGAAEIGELDQIRPVGVYQIDVPYMWSGKITASMTDWGFLPRYRSYYHLTTDRTNQDFTSFQPIISGYVRKSDGSAIVQATLQASNGGPSALTNADGYYEILYLTDTVGTFEFYANATIT